MQFSFTTRQSNSPLVEAVWCTASSEKGVFDSLAESHWGLVITRQPEKTSVILLGPQTRAKTAPVPEGAEMLGLVFKLGVVMPGLQPANLVDKAIELPMAGGNHFWLDGKRWEIPTFDSMDVFASQLAQTKRLLCEPLVARALGQEMPAGMSLRTLQRHFLKTTGMTRGTVQQIERARSALLLLNEGMPAADAMGEAGYYDQSHLIRSFAHYLGRRPGQIQNLSDWRTLLNSTW